MTQRRGTTTDRLANIIQVIQLGRKTGVLSIERGEGPSFEEGVIIFAQGQILEAKAGRRGSQMALNWLKSWGPCRFAFTSSDSDRPTGKLPHVSPDGAGHTTHDTNSRLPATGAGLSRDGSPVPQRTLPSEEALRLLELGGLSRSHRHLFLLIDGQRTTEELVRLMGRRPDEVEKLLRDLQYIRIVQ